MSCDGCIKPCCVNIDDGIYLSVCRSGRRQILWVGITLREFLNIKCIILSLLFLLLLQLVVITNSY